MPRGIHLHHHAFAASLLVGRVEDHDPAAPRAEDLGIAADPAHVFVARDGPETRAVALRVPVDGMLPAQMREHVVGRAVGEELDVSEIDGVGQVLHQGQHGARLRG